jgi:hypothetical protein
MSALLTRTELEWLTGGTKNISKSFQYKMKSIIRRKIQIINEIELPLILRSGLFPDLNFASIFTLAAQPNSPDLSLGKAKVPGPNPGQGLPIFRIGERIEDFDDLRTLPNTVRSLAISIKYLRF